MLDSHNMPQAQSSTIAALSYNAVHGGPFGKLCLEYTKAIDLQGLDILQSEPLKATYAIHKILCNVGTPIPALHTEQSSNMMS